MKYLLIENSGEINPLALTLMGASTKRDDNTKIGFFGSGNKYAIALMLRLGVPFRIFSGTEEIVIGTNKLEFGDQEFDNIYLEYKGERKDTSLTVQMGPQWEPWFAVREIYCNAIDAGGANVIPMMSQTEGIEGKTRIYIGITSHIEPVVANWNNYFANDRIDLFEELPGVRVFYRKDKGMRIYRKGILVYEDSKMSSVFDYDVDEANINESRVLESTYSLRWNLERKLSQHGSPDLLKRLLLGIHLGDIGEEKERIFEADMDFHAGMIINRDNWMEATQGYVFINRSVAGRYNEEAKSDNALVLPSTILHALQEAVNDDLPAHGVPRKGMKYVYKPFQMNTEQLIVLGNAVAFLKGADVDIPDDVEIKAVCFEEGSQMGAVDVAKRTVYVGERAFDMGTKQVASTILEELTHLTTKFRDESRQLQNYLFDKWLTEMEKRTGNYL